MVKSDKQKEKQRFEKRMIWKRRYRLMEKIAKTKLITESEKKIERIDAGLLDGWCYARSTSHKDYTYRQTVVSPGKGTSFGFTPLVRF